VDRILFYTNDWGEAKQYLSICNQLQENGYEIAFSTHNYQLVKLLSILKILLISYETCPYDYVVSSKRLPDMENYLTFEQLLKVINSE